MSLETRHFINGIEIRPVNGDDIGLVMDWTKDISEAELSTDSLILATKGRQVVLDHIQSLGVFEGIPYRFEIGSTVLDYYIDLTDSPKMSGEGDSTIEVKIKRRKALDYFKQQADGLSFDLLATKTTINTQLIDYLIIRDNQLELFIMLSITTYQLTKALIEGIKELANAIADLVKAVTPNATFPPLPPLGAIIALVILTVARLAYVLALFIALINLTKQIIELVFPPLKQFKATTVRELLEKGCSYLGFNFKSSITDFDFMTVLPVPTLCPREGIWKTLFTFDSKLRTKGYPTGIGGDSVSTLGQLIDFANEYINGKPRIIVNDFYLERRDHWNTSSGIQIHNTLNLQDRRENAWSFNNGESWKRYYLKFQVDVMDRHSYDNVEGTYSEHSTEPITVTNPDLVLIKGLVKIEFPFSLGSRKTELNFIEKLFLPYAKLADSLTGSSLASKINARVGVLQISEQYFTNTKLLWTVNGRQPVNYLDLIGAEQSYQKFHYINQVRENFKKIYTATIPFSTANFESLLENNYVNDENGIPLEILTFEWVNHSKTAVIEYAILSDEAFNTKTILIEGGNTSGTTTTALTC